MECGPPAQHARGGVPGVGRHRDDAGLPRLRQQGRGHSGDGRPGLRRHLHGRPVTGGSRRRRESLEQAGLVAVVERPDGYLGVGWALSRDGTDVPAVWRSVDGLPWERALDPTGLTGGRPVRAALGTNRFFYEGRSARGRRRGRCRGNRRTGFTGRAFHSGQTSPTSRRRCRPTPSPTAANISRSRRSRNGRRHEPSCSSRGRPATERRAARTKDGRTHAPPALGFSKRGRVRDKGLSTPAGAAAHPRRRRRGTSGDNASRESSTCSAATSSPTCPRSTCPSAWTPRGSRASIPATLARRQPPRLGGIPARCRGSRRRRSSRRPRRWRRTGARIGASGAASTVARSCSRSRARAAAEMMSSVTAGEIATAIIEPWQLVLERLD